ncbi:MAG TPA: glycosyltransferase [Candidatus Limnocylindrales bacterium]|nr:glycosyltransferase [Candidatus Limnocylindrales bacterium]
MATSTTLSIIVPVYNEQYLVQASLNRLQVLGESPLLSRIKVIVVDDYSTDQTEASLKQFQKSWEANPWSPKFEWIFLHHEENQGKGAAIRTGLEYVDTELVVIHDADLEYHPRDLLKMIPLFLEEDADAVFGSRFLAGEFKRVLFFRHALGNSLLTFLCDLVCDLNITDMETCYKMVRTSLLKSIPLESCDFRIEPEITIKLAKRGARIFEVPISYSGRTYQEGKKINWKDGLLALGAILKYAVSDQIYTADKYGSEILARLNRAPRFTRWMADTVRPYIGKRVLEIGAGIGNITLNLTPQPVYWATDVNPLYLDSLRKLCSTRPYLHVTFTDVTDPGSFPKGQQFDTVICLNVIEHVKDDVAALQNIRNVLEDKGRAIVLVPQGPNLYGSLDRVLGHYRRYTKEQLISVGIKAGFHVQEVLEFNRAGVIGWWLNGQVLPQKTFGFGQIKMLNLLVPLFRRMESWLPLPPLSLIAIFEKVPDRKE